MKVLEFIRGLGLGGAEALLVNRLSAPEALDWRTAVVNTQPAQGHFEPALEDIGVAVTNLPGNVATSSWRTWRLADSADRECILISHSPSIGVVLKLRRALGFGRGQTLVDVVHNSTFRHTYMLLGRFLNRYADSVVFVGHEVSESGTARGYKMSYVVHGGVPGKSFHDWLRANCDFIDGVRRVAGVRPGTLMLVAVGGLTAVKNQSLAIEAVALLRGSYHLVIIGDGTERKVLEAQARTRGVSVSFAGRQPDAWRWIGAADALIHTSRYEGLPVVLMEAAALGIPIVATPFQGAREMQRTGARIVVSDDHAAASVARAVDQMARDRNSDREGHGPPGENYWSTERFALDFYSAIANTAAMRGTKRPRAKHAATETIGRGRGTRGWRR